MSVDKAGVSGDVNQGIVMIEQEGVRVTPREYEDLFKKGQPLPMRIVGLCGRIMRGRTDDDFHQLAFQEGRRLAWVIGPIGLQKLVGMSHEDIVLGIGKHRDWLDAKLREGFSWRLVVFPDDRCRQATWDGLFEMIRLHYPTEVFERLQRWESRLRTSNDRITVSPSDIESDVKDNIDDPRHMSVERYLAASDTCENARLFLWHSLGVNDLFTGTGMSRETGFDEYLRPACRLSELAEYVSIPLEVSLATGGPTRSATGERVRHRFAYSERVDGAFRFMSAAHHEDVRKGTQIPYAMHPAQVAWILDRCGWSEDVVVAGLLHDTLEDPHYERPQVQNRVRAACPKLADAPDDGRGFRHAVEVFIGAQFGEGVLQLVRHVTERKTDSEGRKRDWAVRKAEQLALLEDAIPEVAALKAADTLHNLVAITRDIRRDGLATLSRFNASPEEMRRYYAEATGRIAERLETGDRLVSELMDAFYDFDAVSEPDGIRDAGSEWNEFDRAGGHGSRTEVGASPLVLRGPNRRRIYRFGHWFHAAPPREGARQWTDGRSAKELARAWTRDGTPTVPEEVRALFDSTPALRGVRFSTGLAEHKTTLPGPPGEPRHSDLLLLGRIEGRRVVVAVEAKSDEEFGPLIGDYLDRLTRQNDDRLAVAAPQKRPRLSRVPARIDVLSRFLFGRGIDEAVRRLRYQLLHATVATVAEARRHEAYIAVLLVHEFMSERCGANSVVRNHEDFAAFVNALQPGTAQAPWTDRVYGPFRLGDDAGGMKATDLLIGTVTARRPSRGTD